MINPQQTLYQQLINRLKRANTPQANNVLEMLSRNDTQGIENFGRNIAKERGVDFDAEFQKFKNQFGMK
jgi:formate dehydrogenase maturation protein FdhE